ncbi:hypothetical protein FFLO_02411 [Filobasidium floriforme]|uniref:Thioredoxin domain-containing protein n=1 Tax=Filobasidium floriforme TaxID=5210 RepID=A0A8K0NRS8_9TREE|nr:SCO1 protein [Filobasidium floriforme]KAG7562129.1 hypothetical protein FFLO_02411 [Filobasidium floriforme]KAH8082695.1 SCO1 protein [Filobasidium floriforme]
MQSFQRQVARTTGRSLPLANRNAGSTISRRCISQQTGQGARDRAAVGPFTWRAGALFTVTGVGLYFYFESEKAKVQERKRQETMTKSVGKPNIGGPFNLITQDGKPFSSDELLGKWSLIYFGFTNCPDICPEMLDSLSEVTVKTDQLLGKEFIQPVFISCDPARDTVAQVKRYVSEFHPRMIGLTGPFEAVKQACKAYRVYFSTPPDAKPTEDYLVDHSIFFYLMDSDGQFVDAFGKNSTSPEITAKVMDHVEKWKAAGRSV